MSTFTEALPRNWSASEKERALQIAAQVEKLVDLGRTYRKQKVSAQYRSWFLELTVPHEEVEVLRRLFPAENLTSTDTVKTLFIRHIRVQVRLRGDRENKRSDDWVMRCAVTWDKNKTWKVRIPPAGLSPAEGEAYLTFRTDGASVAQAQEMARALQVV